MTRHEVPNVPGVLSAADIAQTAFSIAQAQESSGALPWFPGGHVDPWDHVESAMALSAAGFMTEAEAAYEWSRSAQRADGSWPMKVRNSRVEDAGAD
ncbi:MAG: prenyltransferase, partial [Actinophytocola sp.]|nr:prenyltransferase [Actinophytocola sp.]